jgi:uncharacterized membrane protein
VRCSGQRAGLRQKEDERLAAEDMAGIAAFWIVLGIFCVAVMCWVALNLVPAVFFGESPKYRDYNTVREEVIGVRA